MNQLNSAPEEYAYCPSCAASMTTRLVGDKPRRVCPECNFIYFTDPKVAVGVAVVQDDQILLVRRSMNPGRGKWSLPAGYVDRGEDPKETAVRECFEETNLTVAISGLIDVYHNAASQGGASIFILYQAQLTGGQLQAGDDADAAGFFALDQLPEIAFASTEDVINRLKADGGLVSFS